jgi:hypothetical protein
MRGLFSAVSCLSIAAIFIAAGGAIASADDLRASVFAGSGAVGLADGPAATATFMLPAQVAFGPDDRILVADAAAQRIRAVAPDGTVTTLAGSGAPNASGLWVPGGYRDGPVLAARFNHPDGVAVAADGSVYVADRDNHCIRRIAGGNVSTFAGSAAETGVVDGPAAAARFSAPMQLALDADGSLYVADWGAGVRRIGADGTVTTLKIDVTHPTGVSIGRSGSRATLFIADTLGLIRYDLIAKAAYRLPAFPTGLEPFTPVNSDFPLGIPHALAAIGPDETIYTDLRDNAVKYIKGNQYVRYLGEAPPEDAMIEGGGYELGPAGPRYDAPEGVAFGPHGDVIVADAGNRRLVRIAPFKRGGEVTPETVGDLQYEPGTYRIALVGSSLTWYFSDFDGSIGGKLQRRLATVPELQKRPPSLRYFRLFADPERDLMRNVLARGAADLVIWMIDPGDYFPLGKDPAPWRAGQDPGAWQPALNQNARATIAALNAGGVPVMLVVAPSYWSLDPYEASNLVEERAFVHTDYESGERQLLQALAGVATPVFDLFPACRDEVRRREHLPLFMSSDAHLTPYGRTFIADQLFAELERRQPWKSVP